MDILAQAFKSLSLTLSWKQSLLYREVRSVRSRIVIHCNLAHILFVEGSDNTSSTVSLAMYFLLANDSLYKTLQTALDKAFPDPTVPLDKDTLAEITLLDAIINETLRLGSPWFLPRVVPEGGAVVENTMIPAGTVVAVAAYSQQTSETNFYPDPMVSCCISGHVYVPSISP